MQPRSDGKAYPPHSLPWDAVLRANHRANQTSFQANLLLTAAEISFSLPGKPEGQTMADQDTAAPWTIKAVTVQIREKAVRYARMDGCTMAEWLAKAVETQASKQDGNLVIPPGKPETPPLPASSVDLNAAAAVLQAMAAAASAGLPVSKAATRDTVALIRERIRADRGLPPRQTRTQIGQTLQVGRDDAL
jgi:hypothetical protein